jgi:hypothetical protein
MIDVDETGGERRINEDDARHCNEKSGDGVARRPTAQLVVTA